MRYQPYLRVFGRWGILTVSLASLLFVAAGTTQELLLRAYLSVFSVSLLTTMLIVNPALAEERVHPGAPAIDSGGRVATGFLFLVTLTTATLDSGRLHQAGLMPDRLRIVALAVFALSTSVQAWAMAVYPFFSPVVRIQPERGHRPITRGPYRFVRHPGISECLLQCPRVQSRLALCWPSFPPSPLAGSSFIARRSKIDSFGQICKAMPITRRWSLSILARITCNNYIFGAPLILGRIE